MNDRGYKTGDLVRFTAVDDFGNKVEHAVNDRIFAIGYVLEGFEGLAPGYVAFSISLCSWGFWGDVADD